MISRRALVAMLLVVAAAMGRPATGETRAKEAQAHLARGLDLYQRGRYDAAIREFLAGQVLDPRPEFLYALGQAERQQGNCGAAVGHFRDYIQVATKPEQKRAARLQLARCEEELRAREVEPPSAATGEKPAPTAAATEKVTPGIGATAETRTSPPAPPSPEPPPAAPPSQPAESLAPAAPSPASPTAPSVSAPPAPLALTPAPAGERPWYRDGAALALFGGGALALLAGGTLLAVAEGLIADAGGSDAAFAAAQHAPSLRIGGAVLLVAGGVAVLGGGIRLGLARRRAARLVFAPARGGALLIVGGEF